MREIKFRAWGISGADDEPSMIYNDDDANLGYHVGMFGDLNNGNYEIMQFTGLLDSEGVEVYEGDIVEHSHKYGKHIETVEWTQLNGEQSTWMGWSIDIEDMEGHVKVIGNIFETGDKDG